MIDQEDIYYQRMIDSARHLRWQVLLIGPGIHGETLGVIAAPEQEMEMIRASLPEDMEYSCITPRFGSV